MAPPEGVRAGISTLSAVALKEINDIINIQGLA